MPEFDRFEKYGLFSARVPRYTSFPPANRFKGEVGMRAQPDWLWEVRPDDEVSLYIHIPFCKRLCWFCACRTQGTSSSRPVEGYITRLLREIQLVYQQLPDGVRMSRLHLGGGTPTILTPQLMGRLLDCIFDLFAPSEGFEFSAEVDPTDAPPEVLDVLAEYGMNRGSIGVQDFNVKVQKAIGRLQSVEDTRRVVDHIRSKGVESVNFDLLYGLPFQTQASLSATLDQVMELSPDRLALYGYAHVPWMSKRQGVIDATKLPDPKARFRMSQLAATRLTGAGFEPVGIDHFARPHDGLALARAQRRLYRNFQGYTDDPASVLLGFGASAISKFPRGYVQNAVATSAYLDRIDAGGLAGFRGYALTDADRAIADMIEQVMCYGDVRVDEIASTYPKDASALTEICRMVSEQFPDVVGFDGGVLRVSADDLPLVRIIASALDRFEPGEGRHSLAI